MHHSEHIQAAADPVTVRPGRPLVPVSALELPRPRRLYGGTDLPSLTRQIPAVEIVAGAALGMAAGVLWALLRWRVGELGSDLVYGTLLGLLTGWLIGTFTGATGTLSVRTVLANMIHIVWVLTCVFFFVGILGFIAAVAGAAYGPDRRDL